MYTASSEITIEITSMIVARRAGVSNESMAMCCCVAWKVRPRAASRIILAANLAPLDEILMPPPEI
jgi:hypothetical protein